MPQLQPPSEFLSTVLPTPATILTEDPDTKDGIHFNLSSSTMPQLHPPSEPLSTAPSTPATTLTEDLDPVWSPAEIWTLNCRSAVGHAPMLADLLLSGKPIMAALTETWFHPDVLYHSLDLPPEGFSMVSQPRPAGTGGGVAFMFSEAVMHSPWSPSGSFSSFEFLCSKCCFGDSTPVLCTVIYRPPGRASVFLDELQLLLEELAKSARSTLLLGDFNFHPNDVDDVYAREFFNLLLAFNYSPTSLSPSHVLGNTLDLIFMRGLNLTPLDSLQLSWADHFLVRATYQPPVISTRSATMLPQRKLQRRWLNLSPTTLAVWQSQFPLIFDLSAHIDEWDVQLSSHWQSLVDMICPLISVRVRPAVHLRNKWYTPQLTACKIMGRTLERRWRLSGSWEDRQKARSHHRIYSRLIKEAKITYLAKAVQSADNQPRTLFALCKQFTHAPTAAFAPPEGFADAIATFFDNKVADIRSELAQVSLPLDFVPFVYPSPPGVGLDSFIPITRDQLLSFMGQLGPSSSLFDPIPTRTVKALAPGLVDPILFLVNHSLAQGWVPASWKRAIITPLLKKSGLDVADMKNFRPVSQLPLLARLSEHFVTDQLQQHCESRGALHDLQSGFRPGRGTETAILDIRERIAKLRDGGRPAALILLDLSAAFDTIDHEILLQRLERVAGVGGHVLGWCRSFLSGRFHQVHVGDQWSEPRPLRCGVPQGSALSPLLFNIYMRPLATLLEDSGLGFQMYADDTQLVVDLSPENAGGACLVSCLERVQLWMRLSWLKLNESKTEILVLDSSSPGMGPTVPWPISFGEPPAPVATARNLGVFFEGAGGGAAHVSAVVKAAHHCLNQLSPILPLLDEDLRASVCQALVLSKIWYCCSFFTGLTDADFNRLQRVQNRAVRAVAGLRRFDHVSDTRRKLGWLRVQDQVKLRGLCLMWRALHGQGPIYLQQLFSWEKRRNPTRYALRGRVSVPIYHRARVLGRCLSCQGPGWWNALPTDIRLSSSFANFKRAVKIHMKQLDNG